jgi:Glyoxalase/Bleomycin resistance protein/Dioxygenase superfamily
MRQPSPHRIHWAAVVFFAAFCSPAAAQSTQNPLQLRPDHATAAVTDLDRAVRWYQDMLGFRVLNRGARPNGSRFADLEIPGYGIGLVQNPGAAPSTTGARSGWVHIVFSVPDPARAFATLKSRGATSPRAKIRRRHKSQPSCFTTAKGTKSKSFSNTDPALHSEA